MTYLLEITLLVSLTVFASAPKAAAQTQSNPTPPLTNAAVVKLVKAGFKEKTVISIIASRPSSFELSPERMIELKRNGVSERIILAMIGRQEGIDISDEEMGDDPFFGDDPGSKSGSAMGNSSPGSGNSASIFGSSGGLRGQTKTEGGSGSSSGDTVTTGSATVRIVRPPAEAGAPPKLEKSPTLKNDSIIELIAAGFTEGTIIRRIEQSPVDFDLSPEKIAELRNQRVSERVLTAMRIAMGESTDPKPTNGTQKKKQ